MAGHDGPVDEEQQAPGATSTGAGGPTAEVPAATPYPPGYGPPPGGVPPGYGPPPGYYATPGAAPPGFLPGYGWGASGAVPSAPTGVKGRRLLVVAWCVAGVLALTVAGLATWLATSGNPAPGVAPSFGRSGGPYGFNGGGGGGGGPFGGGGLSKLGVAGTVANVVPGTFTVSSRSGQTVTVTEQPSTVYDNGTTAATSSIVVQGARVLVEGSRSGTMVTATRVVVLPAGSFGGPPSG